MNNEPTVTPTLEEHRWLKSLGILWFSHESSASQLPLSTKQQVNYQPTLLAEKEQHEAAILRPRSAQ